MEAAPGLGSPRGRRQADVWVGSLHGGAAARPSAFGSAALQEWRPQNAENAAPLSKDGGTASAHLQVFSSARRLEP